MGGTVLHMGKLSKRCATGKHRVSVKQESWGWSSRYLKESNEGKAYLIFEETMKFALP